MIGYSSSSYDEEEEDVKRDRKRRWVWGLGVILWVSLVWGCGYGTGYLMQPAPRYVYDGVKIERQVEGQQYDKFVEAWRVEVARRFSDALVLICHGNTGYDIVTGQPGWYLFPEASSRIPVRVDLMVRKIRDANPGRVLVILSCNPGSFRLTGFPGVYYALDSIWLWPDKNGENSESMKQEPGIVGNIFEFVSAE